MDAITTKKCTKCGEVKALDDFNKCKRGKYGKRAECKGCIRKYQQENRERIGVRQRKWYEENKERRIVFSRKYYEENKYQIAEHKRKYRQENPEVGRRSKRKRRALIRNLPHQPLTPQQYEVLHRQKHEIFGGIANGH